jgi:hypothetical protein
VAVKKIWPSPLKAWRKHGAFRMYPSNNFCIITKNTKRMRSRTLALCGKERRREEGEAWRREYNMYIQCNTGGRNMVNPGEKYEQHRNNETNIMA